MLGGPRTGSFTTGRRPASPGLSMRTGSAGVGSSPAGASSGGANARPPRAHSPPRRCGAPVRPLGVQRRVIGDLGTTGEQVGAERDSGLELRLCPSAGPARPALERAGRRLCGLRGVC